MIELKQLQAFTGHGDQALVDAINAVLKAQSIDTARRIRYFMAQSAFETQNFAKFEESLWYSTPERIAAVWPSRFSVGASGSKLDARDYIKAPERLANAVYGGRNGNNTTGDGWSFRGRGGFHLTFRDNYSKYSQAIYGDDRCVTDPDRVAAPADAMMSAGWFWTTRGLNTLADADEFTKVTQVINGSAATVPERLKTLKLANTAF